MDVPEDTPDGGASAGTQDVGGLDAQVIWIGVAIVAGLTLIGGLVGATGSGEAGAVALIGAGLGMVIAIAVLGVAVLKRMR